MLWVRKGFAEHQSCIKLATVIALPCIVALPPVWHTFLWLWILDLFKPAHATPNLWLLVGALISTLQCVLDSAVMMQVRSKKKADAETQRREEKAAREEAKREREARSYNNVMQVTFFAGAVQPQGE